jgi:lipid A ethanolaminephosphotransferase
MSAIKHDVSRLTFLTLVAFWLSIAPNFAPLGNFFNAPSAGKGLAQLAFLGGGWLLLFSLMLGLLFALNLIFLGRSIKVAAIILVLSAAILSYFTVFLGAQFDRIMVVNLFQTHMGESLELINWRLIGWVVGLGLIPCLVIWKIPLRNVTQRWRFFGKLTGVLVGTVAFTAIVLYSMYPAYASAARNKHLSFHNIAPLNFIAANVSHVLASRTSQTVRQAIGVDAVQIEKHNKLRLVIFVLGETARAKNHGLNGYERDTTPRMKAAGGLYFANTQSCGTSTAVSVPCMFSGLTREDFSMEKARSRETLIHVLQRAGIRALWRDNDSGCKGVCDSSEFENFTNAKHPRWCTEIDNCHDEILFEGLEEKIRNSKTDTIAFLHLKGSHGPAYYKRYPKQFEKFSPTCITNDLSACNLEQLRNAYDNTIVYSDHMIGESIELLKKLSDQFATSLIYVSDHGESLGEAGLFLHGLPYAIAPKEQTEVPMYSWLSEQWMQLERWDVSCVTKQTQSQRSHDNIYATVLGLFDIQTIEYKIGLDIFGRCDPKNPT